MKKGLVTLSFKNGKTIPDMMITLVSKDKSKAFVYFDNIRKDWQLPCKVLKINGMDVSDLNITTKDIGNPKLKELPIEEYNEMFNEYQYLYN